MTPYGKGPGYENHGPFTAINHSSSTKKAGRNADYISTY